MTTQTLPELISITDAAKALNVSTRTIARLIAEARIVAPKVRRRRLIEVGSIHAMLAGNGNSFVTTPKPE